MAKGIYLDGVENNMDDGTGWYFNWILSNGDRSPQKDKKVTYCPYMMPKGAHNRIRSVKIYYRRYGYIIGFSFFDKDGALLWKVGNADSKLEVETVGLAENEVIIGVVAKLAPG